MTEPKALAIAAAEGVEVHIDDSSDAEHFDVKVIKDGAEVESHEGIGLTDLVAASSDHFTAELIEPPTAPSSEEE